MNDAPDPGAPTFCRGMTAAGLRWQKVHEDAAVVRRNLAHALAHRPAGLDPFMVGVLPPG